MHGGIVSVVVRAVSRGALVGIAILAQPLHGGAQTLVDPALRVATVVDGLSQPIAMAFIGPDDFLVTEKASGQVSE